MKINNKFKLDEIVYYPGADSAQPHVVKAKITAIIVRKDEIAYVTDYPTYAVKETDMAANLIPAKKRLIEMLEETEKEIHESTAATVKIARTIKNDEKNNKFLNVSESLKTEASTTKNKV